MPERVLFDAGPLVALFDRDDAYHVRAVDFLREFSGEAVTSLPVITEVVYLLDFSLQAQVDFLRWVGDGAVTLVDLAPDDFTRIVELIEKYADLPMDFTDGVLVAIAERLKIRHVASVDKDFSIYRYRSRYHFHNVFLK